jgi:transcriptional accessory protein Tex/SPT6
MTKPESSKSILAIDPGFRVGCKICVLDEFGNPKLFDKIFLFEEAKTKFKLKDIISEHKIEVVVI